MKLKGSRTKFFIKTRLKRSSYDGLGNPSPNTNVREETAAQPERQGQEGLRNPIALGGDREVGSYLEDGVVRGGKRGVSPHTDNLRARSL